MGSERKHPNPDHSSNVTEAERKLVAKYYAGRVSPLDIDEALLVDDIVLRMRGAYDDQTTSERAT